MKALTVVLVLLALSAPLLAQSAAEKKQQVLDKIDALIAEGDLDTAGRMIDFFLDKNPGDADLVSRKEKWRIAKGDVGPLLEEEGLETPAKRKRLREICWKIVAASMKGNPDEWEAILDAGEPTKAKELLERAAKSGGAEDRSTAEALIERLSGKKPEPMPEKEIEAALAGADAASRVQALREVEDRKLKKFSRATNKLFKDGQDLEVRFAAAGALLALGDEKPRKSLMASLKAERPVEAVLAMEILVRHPGRRESPLLDLCVKVEADEVNLRAKPALHALVIRAIGEQKEEGAWAFLKGKLMMPATAVDAAWGLGALGDEASVGRLLAFVRKPPRTADDDTTGSGLGFLGGQGKGVKDAAAAEELRPRLVGALAILRVTAPKKK